LGVVLPASAVVVALDAPATDLDEALLTGEGLTLDARADDERLVLLALKTIYEQTNWQILGIRNLVITPGEGLTVDVVIENEDTKERLIRSGEYDSATNQWTDRIISESKADEALDLGQWRVDKARGKGSRKPRTEKPKCNTGQPCGMSCIRRKSASGKDVQCRFKPEGAAEEALQSVTGGGESGGGQATPSSIASEVKGAVTKPGIKEPTSEAVRGGTTSGDVMSKLVLTTYGRKGNYAYIAPVSVTNGTLERTRFINGAPPAGDDANRQRVFQGKSGYVEIDISKLPDGFYERKEAISASRKAEFDFLEIKDGRLLREGLSKTDVMNILSPVPSLPDLMGSDKQISWAESIREKAIRKGFPIEDAMSKTDSRYWIDNRSKF
jgi:hypothetical protein